MPTGIYVAIDFKPRLGGIAEHGHQLVSHLVELGERLAVLTPALPGGAAFDATCGYPVRRYGKAAPDSRLKLWRDRAAMLPSLIALARNTRPDYLALDRWSPIAGPNLLMASKLLGLPLILFAHGSEYAQPVPLPLSRKLTARGATRVICVSRYIGQLVAALDVQPERLSVVYSGCDPSIVEAGGMPRESTSPPTILTVSRLTERKGIDRVIAAMPKVLSAVPNARYVIAGDGTYKERLKQLARESPARDAIEMAGVVAGAEKIAYYKQCSVFAMPSYSEGFPLAFLEAAAFGKPTVGTNVGGIPEAVSHGETGILIECCDDDALADALIRLLSEPGVARAMGERGRRRVEREFTWRNAAAKVQAVIHQAIEAKE